MEVSTGGGIQGSALQILLEVLGKAADHHDPNTTTTHDLDALSAQAAAIPMPANALSQILALVIQFGPAVAGLIQALRPHAKPTEMPAPPPMVAIPAPPTAGAPGVPATGTPKVFKEPVAPGAAPTTLESWLEDAWHDWKKSEGNEDGQFDPNADINAGIALPPAPVVWLLTGIQPGTDGHARIPQNEPGVVFPVLTHHFQYEGETEYTFDSNADPGVKQPVPEIGHVQGGDKWQKSQGWGFIIRIAGFGGSGPKTLNYWTTDANGKSNVVAIPMSHAKG